MKKLREAYSVLLFDRRGVQHFKSASKARAFYQKNKRSKEAESPRKMVVPKGHRVS